MSPYARAISDSAVNLQRAATGDRDAFNKIFDAHKDSVHSTLWHILNGDDELVEEAVGNVFLSVYRGLPSFRHDSSFTTWLYRIMINEAKARMRARMFRSRRQEVALADDVAADNSSGYGDPAISVSSAESRRILTSAVQALPEPYRTPIILRYLQDIPSNSISEILHRPPGTVRYQLSRGIQLLRERLGESWTY